MEESALHPAPAAIMQVAYIVDDIEREMLNWARLLRVGPFFHLPHFPLLETSYRGEPVDVDIDVALAFSGGVWFELICQRNNRPSPFRDPERGLRLGFHHFAVASRDFDADLARYQGDGMTLAASARVAVGGRVAYLESASLPGLLEVIEMTAGAEQLFSMVRAASRDWNGSDPIRRVGT